MNEVLCKIGKNSIRQIVSENQTLLGVDTVVDSWRNSVHPTPSVPGQDGLRPPQCGALFAIKAHWTVSEEPATIVMPTGTGKTETMIATVVSEQIKRALVVVPSDLLRKQTAQKFLTLGILTQIGVIAENVYTPSVATLRSTPENEAELHEIIENSNIIVTTVTLLQRFPSSYFSMISSMCDILIVDEAHHIAAKTWSHVKYSLQDLRCLQFTATPFRNDGKKLDGRIIYNFPLALAQEQGYFQQINYFPIWEFDEEKGDLAIAQAAVEQLTNDLNAGYSHAVLVRAKDKKTADRLYNDIYLPLFANFNPVLIHSGVSTSEKQRRMKALRTGTAKIVVCVDMFGEGIDIPNLKIAAVHNKYKSLPITLQFIGRFARTSNGLGCATVITNIANDELNESLQDLYAQDADWNKLLNIKSSSEINKEIDDQEFAHGFNFPSLNGVTIQQMRPKISMTAYIATDKNWNIAILDQLFDPDKYVYAVNSERNVIIIVERVDMHASWTSFKGISDTTWHLHLAYWNTKTKILYINSTIKGFPDILAKALFENCRRISGESVFRSLHGVKRLMLGTVGLLSGTDGPIRFKMFAGIDIVSGITESLKHNTFKSNLFGIGYNGRGKVSIGCSHKGRIWSRWVENISYWLDWCDEIGAYLLDETIDTKNILSGVLIPEVVAVRPAVLPYSIEWPQDLEIVLEERIEFHRPNKSYPYHSVDISLIAPSVQNHIAFRVANEEIEECFELRISKDDFSVVTTKSAGLTIQVARNEYRLSEYFRDHPPIIKFIDQSSLEGNVLVKLASTPPAFNLQNIVALDWSGTDIQKESQTANRDPSSIQYRIIQDLIKENEYCIIFDDDGAGEIADIVTIKEDHGKIEFGLYHCKFSLGERPGSRIDDLYTVCGQAEKSIKWCGDPRKIIDRLIKREKDRNNNGGTRFEVGTVQKLRELQNKLRLYPATMKIAIVQPGVDSTKISQDMLQILSGTAAYLLDTYGITLKVFSS